MSLKSFAEIEWNKFSADGELQFGKISYRPNEVMRWCPQNLISILTSNEPSV